MNKKEKKAQFNKMYLCRMNYAFILFSKKTNKIRIR